MAHYQAYRLELGPLVLLGFWKAGNPLCPPPAMQSLMQSAGLLLCMLTCLHETCTWAVLQDHDSGFKAGCWNGDSFDAYYRALPSEMPSALMHTELSDCF